MIGCLFGLVELALIALAIAGAWKTFEKAGQPGWAAIIPIYNFYVMCLMARKPGWWVVLMLIPVVNLVIGFLVLHEVSKAFGCGVGMTLLLLFLPFVGFPVLGFGEASYSAPAAA